MPNNLHQLNVFIVFLEKRFGTVKQGTEMCFYIYSMLFVDERETCETNNRCCVEETGGREGVMYGKTILIKHSFYSAVK
jgi:hypothetical protein